MSETHQSPVAAQSPTTSEFSPTWGDETPKGARAVLNRIIKEGANVPLFFGQTFITSLRDLGYNHPTSAICEHVDNAIQWGATEVRVYFNQSGKRGEYNVDVLIWDNGQGMAPNVLRAAMSFGGSMCFNNRSGIGRYGVGMKTAALSMGPLLDVYSWQEAGALYNITLDVNDIGNDKSNVVNLPEPALIDRLPYEVRNILTSTLAYPKNADDQTLLSADPERLCERLGEHGTIVFIPECDRLNFKKAQPLADHATKEMARIYRRQIAAGLKLYVNNRLVEAFDPTYWMQNARHTFVDGLRETRSRLYRKWELLIPVAEGSSVKKTVTIRLFCLPIASWTELSRKVLKNDLKVWDNNGISFMRNDREVHIGMVRDITGKPHHNNAWWRLEIDFSAELDEAFGVSVNKQGVRLKDYVIELIAKETKEDLTAVRKSIRQFGSEQAVEQLAAKLTEAERRANDADALQATILPQPSPRSEEEVRALEENLRLLATTYRREGESDDEAFERVKSSKFITNFQHNEDTPFYRVDFKLGKVILTINTAHPFFTKLYEPLTKLARSASVGELADGDEEVDAETATNCSEAVVSLQLLLMSLARTQSEMTFNDDSGERQATFNLLRKQWSMNLATQLTVG